MVGLTAEANSLKSSLMSSQSSPCNCRSEPEVSANTSPLHPSSLVYVRYKDHIIYKNILQPLAEAAERETVGWLTKQNDEIMLIEHDRNFSIEVLSSGQSNGIIILKSCILEIHLLPLQKKLNCHLNSQNTLIKGEFALKPKKRKTQPSRNQ
jgi:hypothetical protein